MITILTRTSFAALQSASQGFSQTPGLPMDIGTSNSATRRSPMSNSKSMVFWPRNATSTCRLKGSRPSSRPSEFLILFHSVRRTNVPHKRTVSIAHPTQLQTQSTVRPRVLPRCESRTRKETRNCSVLSPIPFFLCVRSKWICTGTRSSLGD
ncbi:uncharacterized protein UMAG_11255 [Mycosarcoma maydis]|uniref:Uncharacterized protein n=1 Tax=Mycosarcoma maydis TaxID=5270 RepID=A0A0D1CCS1_MYCMD|nr:uncharacterized protein UMAG_11255 [Ustilago maydis 521]KIS70927.1 hypothetical protein UMAG_11255 [Ustilago maydis 521]|eukprot:XP_011387379.1 hypothetical protein UMAG_11255 [Ustilago maydis 521]